MKQAGEKVDSARSETSATPAEVYAERLERHREEFECRKRWDRILSNLRLLSFAIAALLGWFAFGSQTVAPGWTVPPVLVFIALLIAHDRVGSLEAAARAAQEMGLTPVILGDAIEGEARDVAKAHAELARAAKAPTVLLSGGEVTVTLRGDGGRGGPNTEYLLAMVLVLDGAPAIHVMACDTDGIDGSEDNAGAVIGPETLARAKDIGLDAKACLMRNDAYSFFHGLGDLVVTGPTLTNVNDFRAILVLH